MWIQLKSIQHIEDRGKLRTYFPGDWVNVGKQQALQWLADGAACMPQETTGIPVSGNDAGVLVLSGVDYALGALKAFDGLPIEEASRPELHWPKTIIWDTAECPQVHPARFVAGLGLLDTWEIAVPLWDYKVLAATVGTEDERQETKAVILDLRVPVYDTRLMFVHKTADTERLIEVWRNEPGDQRLAFLRALWQVKPLILALPCNWTGHNAPE